jgi:hypothetical protein
MSHNVTGVGSGCGVGVGVTFLPQGTLLGTISAICYNISPLVIFR